MSSSLPATETSAPTVSVVIPAYNSAEYLPAAVDSVLAQTFGSLEVIVIDDGSTDNTEEVMARYGSNVRYFHQQNAGVSVARNRGIQESRAKYIAFLDADDTWVPEKLERQLSAVKAHPHYHGCYSAFLLVDQSLRPLEVKESTVGDVSVQALLTQGNVIGSICTVVVERSLFDQVGGFDPELSQCADWDMWVRLSQHTPFLYINEPLVTYRQHTGNMSRGAALLEKDSLQVLAKGFAMGGLAEDLLKERRRAEARNYMVLAGTYFHAGLYLDFIRCAARSIWMNPRQIAYLAAFPVRAWKRWRQRRSKTTQ